MHHSGSSRMHWKQLNKEQKTIIIALIIGSIFVFVFSAYRVRQGIYAPFMASVEDYEKNRELIKDPIAEHEALQKRTDTDGDGLSDWAEENIYKTSPYLWSTAGDDVPDNVKIARGENPLCKNGEDCGMTQPINYDLPTTTLPYDYNQMQNNSNAVNDLLTGKSPASEGYQDVAEEAGVDFETLKQQIPNDPAMLRKAILASGKVDKEQLDKISDEELLRYFNEAMQELEDETKQEKSSNAE